MFLVRLWIKKVIFWSALVFFQSKVTLPAMFLGGHNCKQIMENVQIKRMLDMFFLCDIKYKIHELIRYQHIF